jgi:hypothetical protein
MSTFGERRMIEIRQLLKRSKNNDPQDELDEQTIQDLSNELELLESKYEDYMESKNEL